MKLSLTCLCVLVLTSAMFASEPVVFNSRTAHNGPWSDAQTWEGGRSPQAGDFVQVRAGHTVTYDVHSTISLRMVHVAGTLTFSRVKNTRLEVGLLRVTPGAACSEDGFDCHDDAPLEKGDAVPALEVGTRDAPIPARCCSLALICCSSSSDIP